MNMSTSTHILINRLVAKAIDLSLMFLASALLVNIIGPLVAIAYGFLADGIQKGDFRGQSIGKKLMGFQVVQVVRGTSATFKDSAIRNLPIAGAWFFAMIPVWGWLLFVLVGIPLIAIEIYLMATVEKGYRIGDVMADTEVVPTGERTRLAEAVERTRKRAEERLLKLKNSRKGSPT